jgi:hypothetical protein
VCVGIEILILIEKKIHQKALRTYLIEFHDEPLLDFYGEFQQDEHGLRKDEAIRYIYHLMVNMKGNHSMKLIPQSSFTVKSITIDKKVCNHSHQVSSRKKKKKVH